MDRIKKLLTGELTMQAFIPLLQTNEDVQNQLRSLLPQEACYNPQHPFWERISYDSVQRNGFDYYKFLCWMCRFDSSLGDNLNIFDAVKRVYTYTNPNITCTTVYDEAFDLYLDAVGDCFDGPEVVDLVQQLINEALLVSQKTKRKHLVKQKIQHLFHIEDRKRPRWIQGAEWPMGKNSPMQFVNQRKQSELVSYTFKDVDTKELKEVIQFY